MVGNNCCAPTVAPCNCRCGGTNGFFMILVLFILLAIIFGGFGAGW